MKEPCSAGESPESSVCIKKRYILEMKSCSPLGSVDRAFDGFLVLYKVAGTSCELQLITLDSMPPPCKTATLLGGHQQARIASQKRSNLELKS
jgi:hypothetical protein